MGAYASSTAVPEERSLAELHRILARFGADELAVASRPREAAVVFRLQGLNVRVRAPLPEEGAELWRRAGERVVRIRADAAAARVAGERRRRLRSLALVVKAKLEAAASGISTLEAEFLAHLVLADGRTAGEALLPLPTGGPILLPELLRT